MGRIDFVLGGLSLFLLLPAQTPGFMHVSVSELATLALNGSVFSEGSNQRIPQAIVVLCDEGGNPLKQRSTNDSAEFSFQGLRPGHYLLRVQAPGYQSVVLPLDLSLASERGITVTLKPLQTEAAPQPKGETISAHELAMPTAARDLVASGKKNLYTEKNPEAALRDFQSATLKAPTFYEAYYLTGMAFLSLQNSHEAEKQFRRSVDLSQKKYADADIALGTLLLHRNELGEGESLLRQGLVQNPRSWPGQFELGELELSLGHLQSALAAAQTAAELAPRQPVVYRLLAIIRLREKNYPALLTALDSYIELDPDSPAGVRAKELRAQIERQVADSSAAAVAVKK
jgi:tetratricopeptide (TPR) repeat protein